MNRENKCIDCKHYVEETESFYPRCGHPKMSYIVDGLPQYTCITARGCSTMCGEYGKLFEQKTELVNVNHELERAKQVGWREFILVLFGLKEVEPYEEHTVDEMLCPECNKQSIQYQCYQCGHSFSGGDA